jgi:hypothetical protein
MANYRPFEVRFWDDPKVENLSPEGKLTFIFLFTNSLMNESGVYQCTFKKISDNTGIDQGDVEKIVTEELCHLIKYDPDNCVVWVVSALALRKGGNYKVLLKSIEKDKSTVKTILWKDFDNHYSTFIQELVNRCGKG